LPVHKIMVTVFLAPFQVASALALFDEDGDGFLELSELVRYLEATFRVLYATAPSTATELGHTPKTIAHATAQQCFLDAGAHHDQALSAAYFQTWYNRGQGAAPPPPQAAPPPPPAPDHLPWPTLPPSSPPETNNGNTNGGSGFASPTFAEMSSATQLGSTPVDEVFHRLAHSANAEGLLTRRAFETCVCSFAEDGQLYDSSVARVQQVLHRLFEVFDKDGAGAVSFDEVASGLSVLCGGTRDEKVEAAFQLFDTNGDGVISATEMKVYLASVFAVLFEASPDIRARLSVGPEDLAEVTTMEAFELMDSDKDDYLTFDEFRAWYQKSGPGGEDDEADDDEEDGEGEGDEYENGPLAVRGFTLKELRDISGLGALPVHDVFGLFAAAANEKGEIDRDMFGECVAHVANGSLSAGTLDRITDELFEVFDADGNGLVDFTELASGLSVLCGGTRDDKVQAAFQLFDTNGDGVISLEEMTAYLSSVFKLVYATKPELYETLRCGPDELGAVTAKQAFADADANQDGSISFDEFQQWYQAGGFDALSGAGQGQGGGGNKKADAASQPPAAAALTLVAIKLVTGLDQCEVDDVVELFVRGADAEGQLSQAAFARCFQVLAAALESNGATVKGSTQERALVLSQLYALFDPSGSGYADAIELISGLTVLCGGERAEKVRAAFDLHDSDEDGCLSFEELCAYLASIYKVLYEGNRGAHAHGPAMKDTSTLAEATANAAFEALPAAAHRGKMSLEEFTHWYSTAPSFEVEVGNSGEGEGGDGGAAPAMSMQRARWLLNLDRHSLNDVLDTLVEAGPDGHLTLEQFSHALLLLMRLGGNLDARSSSGATSREYSEALNLAEALFEEFDEAGRGRVDLSQLTSGLSILFPVPMAAKVNFAFALYDADGDGLVSFSELVEYLASVFAVLFVTAPELRPSSSLNAEELAEATASQAFGEAGLAPQHKLPKHLFKAFVERGLGFS